MSSKEYNLGKRGALGEDLDNRNLFEKLINWKYIDYIRTHEVDINELVFGLELMLENLVLFDPMISAYKSIGENSEEKADSIEFLKQDPANYINNIDIEKEIINFLEKDISKYSLVTPAIKLLNDKIFGIKETNDFIKKYQNIFLKNLKGVGISISRSFKGGNILIQNIDKKSIEDAITNTEHEVKEEYIKMILSKIDRLHNSIKKDNTTNYRKKVENEIKILEKEIKSIISEDKAQNIFIAVGIDSSSFRKRHTFNIENHNDTLAESMVRAEWAVNQTKYRTDVNNHYNRAKVYEFNLNQSYNDIILTYKHVIDKIINKNGVIMPIYRSIFKLNGDIIEIREDALNALRKKESVFGEEFFNNIKDLIEQEISKELKIAFEIKKLGGDFHKKQLNILDKYLQNKNEFFKKSNLEIINSIEIELIKKTVYDDTLKLMQRYYNMINIPDILKNYINEDFDAYIKRKDLLVSYILYGKKLLDIIKTKKIEYIKKNNELLNKVGELYQAVFEESMLLMKNRDYNDKISGTLALVLLRHITRDKVLLVIGDHIGFGPKNMKNNEKFVYDMFKYIDGNAIIEKMRGSCDNELEYQILNDEVSKRVTIDVEKNFNKKIKEAGDISSIEVRRKEKDIKKSLENIFKKEGIYIEVSMDGSGGDELNFVFSFNEKVEEKIIDKVNEFLKQKSINDNIRFVYTITERHVDLNFKYKKDIYDINGWVKHSLSTITQIATIDDSTRNEVSTFIDALKNAEEYLKIIKNNENNGKYGVVIKFDTVTGKEV